MKNKTAVEWLLIAIETDYGMEVNDWIKKLFDEAIELEKQQHGRTWSNSKTKGVSKKTFEQYYSETYKKPTE